MDIISTIGPSIKSSAQIKALVSLGCNGFRFNSTHMNKYETIKQLGCIKSCGNNIKSILDLPGHKIRVSTCIEDDIVLPNGSEVIICKDTSYLEYRGKANVVIPINIEFGFDLIKAVDELSTKNSKVIFYVRERLDGDAILCKIQGEGYIRPRNGLVAYGMDRSSLGLSRKDKELARFAVEQSIDIIYLSYVTNGNTVNEMRSFLSQIVAENIDYKMPKIYSKIESMDGVKNFKNILKVSDGIVMGRGDLYSEIDLMEYQIIQEQIIKKMKRNKKDLVLATHIVSSLAYRNKPTMSEASDLYRFVKEKVNAVVLVDEVSVGKMPKNAMKYTREFVDKVENKKFGISL